MAPALTAITDTVHFAQTDLVNWTLVTDGNGVILIDAGFPGSRDDVLASVRQMGLVDVAMHIWQPRWLKWSVAISRKGAFTRDGIPTTQALTEDVAAGLPGAPLSIPPPGHTGGHCSFVVDGVLVAGDALVTGHPVSPRSGPQLLPDMFNHDKDGCVRSLAALGMLDNEVLLPGHGPVWRGAIRDAAAQAAPK